MMLNEKEKCVFEGCVGIQVYSRDYFYYMCNECGRRRYRIISTMKPPMPSDIAETISLTILDKSK